MLRFVSTSVCLLALSAVALPHCASADETERVRPDLLRNDQLAVSGRYDRFERLLTQMADVLGHEDPERAELLRRAISKGREQAISIQLGKIAGDLGDNNLGRALEQQEQVLDSITLLLQLLQSEDRRSELDQERERLNDLLKNVSDALSQQRTARARTQNSTAPSSAAPSQQKAISRAEEILKDIKSHDSQADDGPEDEAKPSEQEPAETSSSDTENDRESGGQSSSKPEEETPEAQSSDSSAEDSESSAQDPEEQPSAPSSEGQQSSGSNSRESGSQGQQSDPGGQQTPGRPQVEQARQLMEQALQQLQEQLRDEALEAQDGAIEELQQAVKELQRRLLQLREEEKEMVLASLEARLQRMLTQQTQIYDETVDLAAMPVDDWLDTMFARSREMAQQQTELQVICSQTLGLLREDGTSVAIVLSVEDISTDMNSIAERLRNSKVGSLTQSMETDIIEALQELIQAMQREMQDMKSEDRQQQQQAQSGQQQNPPLVELMAEIKVLRSLQLRINGRTERVNGLLTERDGGNRTELQEQLQILTDRQQRLVESAQELGSRIK